MPVVKYFLRHLAHQFNQQIYQEFLDLFLLGLVNSRPLQNGQAEKANNSLLFSVGLVLGVLKHNLARDLVELFSANKEEMFEVPEEKVSEEDLFIDVKGGGFVFVFANHKGEHDLQMLLQGLAV